MNHSIRQVCTRLVSCASGRVAVESSAISCWPERQLPSMHPILRTSCTTVLAHTARPLRKDFHTCANGAWQPSTSSRSHARHLTSAALPQVSFENDDFSDKAVNAIQANVGFVGVGNMGTAILRGWMASGIAAPERLAACVRTDEAKDLWEEAGLQVFGDALKDGAAECAKFSDIIFLGVKPQYLGPVLDALAPHITKKHTIVSIAAGWTIAQLESHLPPATAVVRVMPNTPLLVGQGASGYCVGRHASHEDVVTVHALLEACGMAMEIEEPMMDALTAVSGSGPAYMFMMLDAMADGGVAAGLPRAKALALAAQTMRGAAEMVLNSSGDGSLTHPGVLKDRVASPAGTTIEALAVLEEEGLRNSVIKAVRAAAARSREMSQHN